MVVNNGVTGDSRVQRCATAAARAGWDVTVLGRSPDGDRHEDEGPGGARTVLVPVRAVMAAGRLRRLLRERRLVDRRLAARDRLAGHRGRAFSHGGWRVLDPWLADYELAVAQEIERLHPAVIHVHDRHPIPTVARSVAVLRDAGHDVAWVLDAHEDVTATASRGAGGVRGWARRRMVHGEQDEWIREADAVVTVSSDLAEELARRHRLTDVPTVVQNAPEPASAHDDVVGLRERLSLGPDTPLLVYAGSCAPARGVETAIDALPRLDDVRGRPDSHLALVASPSDPHMPALLARAADLGLAGRVHRVDYVPADEVVALLRSADVGLVPLLHRPNHEIALVTKYLEYLHAGVPVVCSTVRTMARFTRDHGLGEVFRAGDPLDLARAAAAVLGEPDAYRDCIAGSAAVRATAWPVQAARLVALYERVAPPPGRTTAPSRAGDSTRKEAG